MIGARWSPDGSMLVYQGRDASSSEIGNLYTVDVGTGETSQITDLEPRSHNWWFLAPTFGPDGQTVLFHQPRVDGGRWDPWVVPVTGGEPTIERRDAAFGVYSPDGRTLAFLSPIYEFRGGGLWIADAAGGPARKLVGGSGGIGWPRWSPDGTRIAYVDDGAIHVVEVATGETSRVVAGGEAEWFADDTLVVGPGG